MPFKLFNQAAQTATELKSEANPPIFLIPGITGDGKDFLHIAKHLSDTQPGRLIFVWDDPRHPALPSNQSRHAKIGYLSLSNHAKLIQEEILTLSPKGPYLIAGYSFGGALAAAVAKNLNNVSLFVIDAPELNLSKQHLKSKNIKATKDFIAIINYAAKISGLKEVNFSQLLIEELNEKAVKAQLDIIYNHISDNEENSDCEAGHEIAFLFFYKIIKNNLLALLNENLNTRLCADHLAVLTTKETRDKYECKTDAGWNGYANTVSLYPFDNKNMTHLSLIKKEDAPHVAVLINAYFKNILLLQNRIQPSALTLESKQLAKEETIKTTPQETFSPFSTVSSPSSAHSQLSSSTVNTPPISPGYDLRSASRSPQRAQDDCKLPTPPASPPLSPHIEIDRLSEEQVNQLFLRPKAGDSKKLAGISLFSTSPSLSKEQSKNDAVVKTVSLVIKTSR